MSSESATGYRILVIDDNPSIHQDFGKILQGGAASDDGLASTEAALFGDATASADLTNGQLSFDLHFALQGRDGLKQVKEAVATDNPFAMAFVDMRMPPGWDGLETIEHLWAVQPELQVVICTAYSDYSWDEVIQRLGNTDRLLLLKKPFDAAEVWQMANALSEKWHIAQQNQHQLLQLQQANDELKTAIDLRDEAEAKLRHDAGHDPLTDLPNRALLMERVRRCIARAKRREVACFALLFMDLDNFKLINDSCGHSVGDKLLVEFAARLAAALRELDTVAHINEAAARLGGDEFVVLLEEIRRESDAVAAAERLRTTVSEPFDLDGSKVNVSVSIGVAVGGASHDESAEDLLRDADTAMYCAKMSGKSQVAVFNQTMHEAVTSRLRLDGDMRLAVEQEQFQLFYQPIVALESGRIMGFEALLRWNHPEQGMIAPLEFIPVAEDNGLIVPIGQWVLDESCRQLARWQRGRSPDETLSISVNVSHRQLSRHEFVDSVKEAIARHELQNKQLHLEITESLVMSDPGGLMQKLETLRGLGVGLHMDDFGTGHSSLASLHRFPFDVLKIDRSFVHTSTNSRDYAAIVQAITTLAHNLDVKVVVEGIERAEQVAQLISLDCDYGQGFFYTKPVDASAIEALLDSGGPWLQAA